MKRLTALLIICFFLFIPLCGCSLKETVSSHNQEYLVSALGFDETDGKVNLYIESVIVNTEDPNAEIQTQLIDGTGNSITEAFYDANKKTAQPLMLSHCGVIVIGSNVSPTRFAEICKFCYNKNEITLSAFFVSTDNPTKLLSSQAISSISVGYDIMSMIEQQGERTGIEYKNRFFEIESVKSKPFNTFSLPFLKTAEEGYYIEGIAIYNDYAPVTKLDNTQTALYSIITDTQGAGKVLIEGKETEIKSSYATWKFQENEKLEIRLLLDLRLGETQKKQKETIKNNIIKLFENSKLTGVDIFALGNILHHMQKGVWEKIQKDYVNQFKTSVLTVELQ